MSVKTVSDLKDIYYLSVKVTLNRYVLEEIKNFQDTTHF